MFKSISKISAREILDSRGNPTISVTLASMDKTATCSVPSGASKGTHEAFELRDNDLKRFDGKGVLRAVNNIETVIGPAILGTKTGKQKELDSLLCNIDGTKNKSSLGANAILAVSIAYAKLTSQLEGKELHELINELIGQDSTNFKGPKLFSNVINGGVHFPNSTSIQEFHAIPTRDSLIDNINLLNSFQENIKKYLIENNKSLGTGDEGGYGLHGLTTDETLGVLQKIKTKMKLGSQLVFGLDIAANEFVKGNKYFFDGDKLTIDKYREKISKAIKDYHVFAVEDPFGEEEFGDFSLLQKKHPHTIIIGDDLTTTNPERLKKAIKERSISGIIIKPNQIGTLSETLEVMTLAKKNNIHCIASHRSGETNDDFIADIAWGAKCFGIKIGGLQRGERIAKYNRLLKISSK